MLSIVKIMTLEHQTEHGELRLTVTPRLSLHSAQIDSFSSSPSFSSVSPRLISSASLSPVSPGLSPGSPVDVTSSPGSDGYVSQWWQWSSVGVRCGGEDGLSWRWSRDNGGGQPGGDTSGGYWSGDSLRYWSGLNPDNRFVIHNLLLTHMADIFMTFLFIRLLLHSFVFMLASEEQKKYLFRNNDFIMIDLLL